MKLNVVFAIFKRNFVSYFSNPTGYVFICVFVLLTGLAAFWPDEFFTANLANLDQLNRWLPYIMLVFIPAITMSVWSEERRLGTDELLLTIPAGDFEVVIGKYLATLAIYSCALAFSAVATFVVLFWAGSPDRGLFAGMYFGYWMVGMAMLAIGMTASFLTSNLTVGFILGAVFNAPLVFASQAEVILPGVLAGTVKEWSIEAAFRDFGRGVVSLSSIVYFVSIAVVTLYLSVVLIGRRHWWGGRDGHAMLGHYAVRAVSLLAVAAGLTMLCSRFDVRADVTEEKLTALSQQTEELIDGLETEEPVIIDAFISPQVPESYVQTRIDLINVLRELDAMGGNRIDVRIHETEPFSKEAERAQEQYDIRSEDVLSVEGGTQKRKPIFLGVAFSCGLQKVSVPFIDRGTPVEYELVRSIATVAKEKRKKVGVLETDARLYGQFSMQGATPDERIIAELEKQYEVVKVNPESPITDEYDVLLAVQPSTLSPQGMDNFLAAVKRGQPTAIFEDPFPYFNPSVPGTVEDRRPPQQMMGFGGRQPPPPKGDINKVWDVLGIQFSGDKIIWQDYNPYKKIGEFHKEFVFIGEGSGAEEPFNMEDSVTSGLQEMLLLFPGSISRGKDTGPTYSPLLLTGNQTATVDQDDAVPRLPFGRRLNPGRVPHHTPDKQYALAARIRGRLKDDKPLHPGHDGEHEDEAAGTKKPSEVNVVVVADIDCLFSVFFQLRDQGDNPDNAVNFNFDNVTFVLNALDDLAGDDRFIEIRKRRRQHRRLTRVEKANEIANAEANEELARFRSDRDEAKKEEEAKFKAAIDKIKNRTDLRSDQKIQMVQIAQETGQQRLNTRVKQLERKFNNETEGIQTELAQTKRGYQRMFKYWAVLVPPIFPMLMGIVIFFNRRSKERQGVPEMRLRRAV